MGPLHNGTPLGCGTQWLLAPHATAGLSGLQLPPPVELLDTDVLAEDDDTDVLAEDDDTDVLAEDDDTDVLAEDDDTDVLFASGTQLPLLHDSPSRHCSPQLPQFDGSLLRSAQLPAHGVSPGEHPTPPAPP
jgi:hypothetical protein